jgi:hypothetical protein
MTEEEEKWTRHSSSSSKNMNKLNFEFINNSATTECKFFLSPFQFIFLCSKKCEQRQKISSLFLFISFHWGEIPFWLTYLKSERARVWETRKEAGKSL